MSCNKTHSIKQIERDFDEKSERERHRVEERENMIDASNVLRFVLQSTLTLNIDSLNKYAMQIDATISPIQF